MSSNTPEWATPQKFFYRKRAVFQISASGEIVSRHASIRDASRVTGISVNGIHRCLKGTLITSGGYGWAYVE